MSSPGPILITGCSTGIGRATAERLVDHGHLVYASARRIESIADLERRGCRTVALDVTDTASMEEAVGKIAAEHGYVWGLVNNAGYGLHGAIETTSMDEVRRQFETNLFGLVELTQMVLPGMRERRSGRIVNISSMGGRFTFPGGGFYHASKHALEALSDALRYELRPFGIDVVVIQPGLIKSRFGDAAVATVEAADPLDPYESFNRGVARKVDDAYNGLIGKVAAGPGSVARVIERALTSHRPRSRYIVGPGARLVLVTRRILPDRAWDAMLRTQYPQPRPR